MNSYKIEGLITAISQVTQTGDQKTGATTMLPTKDVWFDGDSVKVPYISGNSIRGRLRRLVMADFCRRVDYQFTNEHVWHSFFGGGQLQSVGPSGVIDMALRKKITDLIPPVALWGFSLGNQVLESKMIVQNMEVLCDEMRDYVPDRFQQYCIDSYHRFVSSVMFTRKDDRQDGRVKDEDGPAIQMKVGVQVLIPGTRFYHGFVLRRQPTDVEIACLHHALATWSELPTIGGKSSTGFGQLKLEYDDALNPQAYLDHLASRKAEIVSFLRQLEKDFKAKVTAKNKKEAKSKAAKEKNTDEGGSLEEWVTP